MKYRLLKLNSLINDYHDLVMDLEAKSGIVFQDRRITIDEARKLVAELLNEATQ